MGDTQLYLKHDVQRLILVLLAFIAIPCALLVFLAHQSLRAMGESVVRQYRETCRLELREIGRQAQQDLDNLLDSSSKNLRSLNPAELAFWDEAIARVSDNKSIRTPLVLDSNGKLVIPLRSMELPSDLPSLSEIHPAQLTLAAAREAHWVEADYSRAIGLYKQVLNADDVPSRVWGSVWAEMAQSEEQRGDHLAALDDYEHMWQESQGNRLLSITNPPPLFALLHAVEVSQNSGLPNQLQSWANRLLERCEKHWFDLDPEQLNLVVQRLSAVFPEHQSAEIGLRLKRLVQFARLRSTMTMFTREHGIGPFQLGQTDTNLNIDESTSLWRSPGRPSASDSSWILVYTGTPLSDGHRLAFDIDLAELRHQILEPLLNKLAQTRGGQVDVISLPNPIPSEMTGGDGLEPINLQLPPPLEFWVVHYNIEPSPMLHSLTASQSRFQVTLLILAVVLVLVGSVVLLLQINRSVRLTQLQADVIDRIGHELKTPIAAAAVLASTLARDCDTDTATQKQIVGLLYNETQSLVRLSDRLLSYVHLRSGAARLHLAEHRLDQVVSEAVQLFLVETGVNRSCVALGIEPADYRGSFDRAAIEEISRNLLDNAVKYCDGQPHVRVTLRRVDNECILKVSDNGWGMDKRVQQQIFRPYFRADTSLRAKVPGIGLGLTIVRSLVREHGGTITVHSSPAQGSTFEVRLPLNRNVFRHT